MTLLDLIVVGFYFALASSLGLVMTRRDRSDAEALLLGRRSVPAWAAMLSLVATELSAATFIGVPHAAYSGDWSYLELAFGALLGKAVLATWVIPLYHRRGYTTVYGFLAERFGQRTRWAAALCFVCGRILASGARLFIAALAFSAAFEDASWIRLDFVIVACGAAAALYTRSGGIRAVIWTDVLQGAVFVVAALATLWALLAETGLTELLAWGDTQERTRIFHLVPLLSLRDGRALGTAVAAGFFLTCATHATDHDMVQRLLTTRRARGGSLALLGSALLNFPLTLLFLLIGTGLAQAYSGSSLTPPEDTRQIFAFFALHELPAGVRGLVFAGLFAAAMSSLDSAICAIATTFVSDIAPRTEQTSEALARRMRRSCDVVAVLLVGAAIAMAAVQRALAQLDAPGSSLIEFALSAMGILYGGLLGIFALGFATRKRGSDRGATLALAVGALGGAALFVEPLVTGESSLAWGWRIPLCAALTIGVCATTRTETPRPH